MSWGQALLREAPPGLRESPGEEFGDLRAEGCGIFSHPSDHRRLVQPEAPSRAASLRWSSDIRSPLPNWKPGTELHSRGAPESEPFRPLTASSPRNVTSFAPRTPQQLLFFSLLLKTICLPEVETFGSQTALFLQPTSAYTRGNVFLSFAVMI